MAWQDMGGILTSLFWRPKGLSHDTSLGLPSSPITLTILVFLFYTAVFLASARFLLTIAVTGGLRFELQLDQRHKIILHGSFLNSLVL